MVGAWVAEEDSYVSDSVTFQVHLHEVALLVSFVDQLCQLWNQYAGVSVTCQVQIVLLLRGEPRIELQQGEHEILNGRGVSRIDWSLAETDSSRCLEEQKVGFLIPSSVAHIQQCRFRFQEPERTDLVKHAVQPRAARPTSHPQHQRVIVSVVLTFEIDVVNVLVGDVEITTVPIVSVEWHVELHEIVLTGLAEDNC